METLQAGLQLKFLKIRAKYTYHLSDSMKEDLSFYRKINHCKIIQKSLAGNKNRFATGGTLIGEERK